MLYYKPQSMNPDRHPKMPESYPWMVSSTRSDIYDIEITQQDYDSLVASISLVEYEQAILLEGSFGDFIAYSEASPMKVSMATSVDNTPFATKTISTPTGTKKLFARVHGIQPELIEGSNTIDFTIPYPWVKITGIMVYGGETLDKVDLSIYDTAAGTYSGVPNYKLNQFGFAANISKDNFEWTSPYDADLYQGMIIKVTYTSISAKSIGINFILNEVK
jgi:hypothetical protein